MANYKKQREEIAYRELILMSVPEENIYIQGDKYRQKDSSPKGVDLLAMTCGEKRSTLVALSIRNSLPDKLT